MAWRPPFPKNYPLTALLAVLALAPQLIASTALLLCSQSIAHRLNTTLAAVGQTAGMSDAAFAVGAIGAAELTLRVGRRPLLLAFVALACASALLCAFAPNVFTFAVGRTLMGLAAGLLIVVALPPLIVTFPVEKIGLSAAILSIVLFGAAGLGPIAGGVVAETGAWRWFFAGEALLSLAALGVARLTLEHTDPMNAEQRFDPPALALTIAGVAGIFYGIQTLQGSTWSSPLVFVPVALGLLALAALLVTEFRRDDPLLPVKQLSTAFPLIGTLTATVAGATYFAMLQLLLVVMQRVDGLSAQSAGFTAWPDLAGLAAGGALFGCAFRTRFVMPLTFAGLLLLVGCALLFDTFSAGPPRTTLLVMGGVLGFGGGLTIAPGLFIAGLSAKPQIIGRAVALVETIRLSATYLAGPALQHALATRAAHHFAALAGTAPAHATRTVNAFVGRGAAEGAAPALLHRALASGLHDVLLIVLALLFAGIAAIVAIFVGSGARIHAPDLRAYLERKEPALESPAVIPGSAAT